MLIKSLFNLETNSTANLPNQYFAMLEKQQKYKQLTDRVSKINQFQNNFIECMSTIKITLIQLINEFFKPSEESFLKKIQHALSCSFDTVNTVCLDLNRKVQIRLFNYQNEIANLSKKYKEELQQTVHYQKKVQSIRKSFVQTREDKQKLKRNIDKKRFVESQCLKTQKLLRQNYENFQVQVEKLLQQCPRQILTQFIDGNFLTHSKLTDLIGQQTPQARNIRRRCSVISAALSDISDLDGSDKVSECSDEVFNDSDLIQIIIEPQSTQTMKNESQIIIMDINQETSDGQYYLKVSNPSKFQESNAKKLRRSTLRKASIENNLKIKENHLQKVKKLIDIQNDNKHLKNQSSIQLDKAFEKIRSPQTLEKRRHQIFNKIKNTYCENNKKHIPQKNRNQQKIILNTNDTFYQKSFVLQKQEFKNKHSPNSHKRMALEGPKKYLKNEETLNYLPENDESSQSTSRNQQSSSASLSSIMQIKKQGDQNIKRLPENRKHLKTEFGQQAMKQYNCNQQQKNCKYKRQSAKDSSQQTKHKKRQHAISNYETTLSFDISNQNFDFLEEKKHQKKLGQQQKHRVIEQLFSIASIKNKKNHANGKISHLNSKQVHLTTQESHQKVDAKNWFSTTFLYPQSNKFCPQKRKNENIQSIKDMSNKQLMRTKNTNQPLNDNKIDFSIFSKIV